MRCGLYLQSGLWTLTSLVQQKLAKKVCISIYLISMLYLTAIIDNHIHEGSSVPVLVRPRPVVRKSGVFIYTFVFISFLICVKGFTPIGCEVYHVICMTDKHVVCVLEMTDEAYTFGHWTQESSQSVNKMYNDITWSQI